VIGEGSESCKGKNWGVDDSLGPPPPLSSPLSPVSLVDMRWPLKPGSRLTRRPPELNAISSRVESSPLPPSSLFVVFLIPPKVIKEKVVVTRNGDSFFLSPGALSLHVAKEDRNKVGYRCEVLQAPLSPPPSCVFFLPVLTDDESEEGS